MRIAACQVPEVLNDIPRAWAVIERETAAAEQRGADLVLFPECFLQGYDVRLAHAEAVAFEVGSSTFQGLSERLASRTPIVVVGLIEKENGKLYNTAVALFRGQVVARYRKTHLIGNEKAVFEPGSAPAVFEAAGTKVGINICYDLQFSEPARAAASQGAKVLVCPCNNMMRRQRAEAFKLLHNESRALRAQEARVWLVSADVTGDRDGRISYGPTAVIDPTGRVVEQVPLLTEGSLLVDVPTA